MSRIKLSPSLLSSDFTNMGSVAREFQALGVDIIHLDVMDGNFVPPITFGSAMVRDLKKVVDIPLDAHLMVANPENQIPQFLEAGADMITIHYEATDNPVKLFNLIKSGGSKPAISLNPDTDVSVLENLLKYIDMVLVMSVNPGYGGQKFIENSIDKIKWLANKKSELNISFDIQVDGGINEETISSVLEAGANIIVTGSALAKAKDKPSFIAKMRGE